MGLFLVSGTTFVGYDDATPRRPAPASIATQQGQYVGIPETNDILTNFGSFVDVPTQRPFAVRRQPWQAQTYADPTAAVIQTALPIPGTLPLDGGTPPPRSPNPRQARLGYVDDTADGQPSWPIPATVPLPGDTPTPRRPNKPEVLAGSNDLRPFPYSEDVSNLQVWQGQQQTPRAPQRREIVPTGDLTMPYLQYDPAYVCLQMVGHEGPPRRLPRQTPPPGDHPTLGPVLADSLQAWNVPPAHRGRTLPRVREGTAQSGAEQPRPSISEYWVATAPQPVSRPIRATVVLGANATLAQPTLTPIPLPDIDPALMASFTSQQIQPQPFRSYVAACVDRSSDVPWFSAFSMPVNGPFFVVAAQISWAGAVIGDVIEE